MASDGIICLDDFEKYARETMNRFFFNYYSGGADDGVTVGENRNAFKRLVTGRRNKMPYTDEIKNIMSIFPYGLHMMSKFV